MGDEELTSDFNAASLANMPEPVMMAPLSVPSMDCVFPSANTICGRASVCAIEVLAVRHSAMTAQRGRSAREERASEVMEAIPVM